MMYALALAQCIINIVYLGPSLDREDLGSNFMSSSGQILDLIHLKYSLSATQLTIAFVLVLVARYVRQKNIFIE